MLCYSFEEAFIGMISLIYYSWGCIVSIITTYPFPYKFSVQLFPKQDQVREQTIQWLFMYVRISKVER